MSGTVIGIYTTPSAGEPMKSHERILAVSEIGLEGDRYALGLGFYSARPLPGGARQLTLIERESLDAIANETGVRLGEMECRRNLVTRGIDLHSLIGKRFLIGEVECEGVRDCPPCEHLEELTGKTVMKAMARRGGIRANVLSDGAISVNDTIAETAT